jgi:signal transduction histidine kinase
VTRSLRRALAARFAATMALGLAGASAVVCWGATQLLEGELDRGLAAGSFIFGEHLRDLTAQPGPEPLLAADRGAYARGVNRYMVLRDAGGRVLHALPRHAADLPYDTVALRRAAGEGPVWLSGSWGGTPVRSFYRAWDYAGVSGDNVIQVAASLQPIRSVQAKLLQGLGAVIVLGTVATLVGAWWLAGSAVRPVMEITDQATSIAAGTLDQRIAAHADTDEYRGLVAVLNRMLERLDQAFRNQQRLTADVSHELRTPLTALRGEMEVALRAERSPRDYQRVLHSALEEIDRLTAMSEHLLLITRAEARLIEPQRIPIDLNGLVRDGLEGLRHRILERDLTVHTALAPGGAVAVVDPALTGRLVDQLLDNAVKFTPIGGSIGVSTEASERGVRLAVDDSGPGFPAQDLPHVFEPFYRADQARSSGSGLGLGLTMAAAVVRLQGGRIRAVNVNGSGARVEVDLPAVEPHVTV